MWIIEADGLEYTITFKPINDKGNILYYKQSPTRYRIYVSDEGSAIPAAKAQMKRYYSALYPLLQEYAKYLDNVNLSPLTFECFADHMNKISFNPGKY